MTAMAFSRSGRNAHEPVIPNASIFASAAWMEVIAAT